MIIALPDGTQVPIDAPRVRTAKAALARVKANKPSPATAEQNANWKWQLRAAQDVVRNAVRDVMNEYGLYVDGNGVVAVDPTRWPHLGDNTVVVAEPRALARAA